MTGLLVSVRDRVEAEIALAAGADLIDLKEPTAGSLGAVSPAVMHEVAAWLADRTGLTDRTGLSVALGELETVESKLPGLVPAQVDYAKLGLARCADLPDWELRWQAVCRRLPPGVAPVAVVYADWSTAAAPEPYAILAAAVRQGVPVMLIDTFDKRSGGLFDHWPADELAQFVSAVRSERLKLVLGGSLNRKTVATALEFEPDYIAVRGAVCRSGRNGRVDGELIAELREAVCASSKRMHTSGR